MSDIITCLLSSFYSQTNIFLYIFQPIFEQYGVLGFWLILGPLYTPLFQETLVRPEETHY